MIFIFIEYGMYTVVSFNLSIKTPKNFTDLVSIINSQVA